MTTGPQLLRTLALLLPWLGCSCATGAVWGWESEALSQKRTVRCLGVDRKGQRPKVYWWLEGAAGYRDGLYRLDPGTGVGCQHLPGEPPIDGLQGVPALSDVFGLPLAHGPRPAFAVQAHGLGQRLFSYRNGEWAPVTTVGERRRDGWRVAVAGAASLVTVPFDLATAPIQLVGMYLQLRPAIVR